MTQRDLDTAVAVATGESPSVIRRRGFGIADPLDVNFDPEPSDVPPQWLEWEQMQEEQQSPRRIHSRRNPRWRSSPRPDVRSSPSFTQGTLTLITITRSLARQLRAVFRRAGIGKAHGGYGQRALFLAAGDTLRIRGLSHNAAVEYQAAHQGDPVEALVPLDLLAACEGSRPDPVQLDFTVADKVTASWTDKRVPVVLDFATSAPDDTLPPFPPLPETFATNEPELWTALREAAATTDQQPHRFALSCVQLCGTSGKIVATDGQQALVQSGFTFPWTDDLLVPASDVFGCRELPADQPIQVGKTEDWVTFKTGPWTISLKLEKDARFPDVSRHIGDPAAAASHLRIADSDGDFLNDALPRLPCEDNTNCPVTLDLNGQVLIRGKAADQSRATELALSNSRLEGDADHRQLEPRVPAACPAARLPRRASVRPRAARALRRRPPPVRLGVC